MAAYDLTFEGCVIKDPMHIKVTLPYTDIIGIDPSDINLKYWEEEKQQCLDSGIFDININTEGHSICFKTTHTSVFAVFLENQSPIANADPDRTLSVDPEYNTIVTLDGKGSTDPDGDPLTYSWS